MFCFYRSLFILYFVYFIGILCSYCCLFGVLNRMMMMMMMMIVGLYRTLCSADVRTVVCSNDLVSY